MTILAALTFATLAEFFDRRTVAAGLQYARQRKAELYAQVVDGDGPAAGGITADDIRALFESAD